MLSNQEFLLPTFRSGDVVVEYPEIIFSSLVDFLSNEEIGNVGSKLAVYINVEILWKYS